MSNRKDAIPILERARRNPLWFFENVLGVRYLTPQQIEVITSVQHQRRTAVKAGHGVGKTWLAARLALWFLYTHPRAKVITTAPTWKQVKNLLWRELRSAHAAARYPLGGIVNQTDASLADDWFAVGVSTNDSTNFQGYHAPHVMVIFDEATGVSSDIWDASNGLAVGQEDRFLAIGNPTDPTSEFKRADDSGLWNSLVLSAEDHPNVRENRIVVPGAVTREWIAERLIDYVDTDSALYRARVRGLWPEEGDDVLIPLRLVEQAQMDWQEPTTPLEAIGCDVARYGSDETVTFPIHQGGIVGMPHVKHGQNLMATANYLFAQQAPKTGIDDSGLGGGVTDRLRELGLPGVIPCLAGSSAYEDQRFVNARAEFFWALRDALKANVLKLPKERKLEAELTNHKFSYDSRGRVKLESKADIKERLGRSPDRADALVIANWARRAEVIAQHGDKLW